MGDVAARVEIQKRIAEAVDALDEPYRAAIVYLVQRADCASVAPADDIDPAYGAALRSAAGAGVELFALGARVTSRSIAVERSLPAVL